MSEQMQKFDISDVIRTKVREMFKDIIPDDVLDQYLNREVKGFFTNQQESQNWGSPKVEIPHSSPFALMVRAEVLAYLKESLADQIRAKTKALVDDIGAEGLADLIGKAKARYEQDIATKLYERLFNDMHFRVQEIVGQMKSEGRL
jgi:hypothetical protein